MDRPTFDHVLETSDAEVCRTILALGGQPHDAQDAYQDACVSVLEYGPRSFQTSTELRACLAACACMDYAEMLRRRQKQ